MSERRQISGEVAAPYDGDRDFAESIKVAFEVFKDRMEKGGRGWRPKAATPSLEVGAPASWPMASSMSNEVRWSWPQSSGSTAPRGGFRFVRRRTGDDVNDILRPMIAS